VSAGGYNPTNKDVLDALSVKDGELQFNDRPIGGNGGASSGDTKSAAKSAIAAGDNIEILKSYDPLYGSRVVSVQKFVATDATDIEEVARVYNNTTTDSFEANPYVDVTDGFGLITSQTIIMDEVSIIGSDIVYGATIDLTKYETLEVL
jgi:hypothetical protein